MWNDEGLGIRLTNLENGGAFALTVPVSSIETNWLWLGNPSWSQI